MDRSEFRSSADKFAPAHNSRPRPHGLFGVIPLIQNFTLLCYLLLGTSDLLLFLLPRVPTLYVCHVQ
jgi:hypothetical protein